MNAHAIRTLWSSLAFASVVAAQTADQASPGDLTRQLRNALETSSLVSAADIAARLDTSVQDARRKWLPRDSKQRIESALAWIPADTESLWANQEPFEVDAQDVDWAMSPIVRYSLDRLAAQNDGAFFRALDKKAIALVIAAASGIELQDSGGRSVPAVIRAASVTYFYFLAEPVDFPNPYESIGGRPAWKLSAKRQTSGEDTNYLVMARPDLMILTNNRDTLNTVLARMDGKAAREALPPTMPEWAQTDRNAPFWGIRHYSAASRPKPGYEGCASAMLPFPDCEAIGTAVRMSADQHVDIRYLSLNAPNNGMGRNSLRMVRLNSATWQLKGDAERQPWTIDFSMAALGFGSY